MELTISLVRAGVVSAADYVAAQARKAEDRVPLGQIAIEEGVLTGRQVLSVLRQQHAEPEKRFGEIAIAKGWLTPLQVEKLLVIQIRREDSLIDHLVELGSLSRDQALSVRRTGNPRSANQSV